MPEPLDDRRRRVVPRWWDVRVAASLGQLDAATAYRVAAPLVPVKGEVEDLLTHWERQPNRFHAAELVDAALALDKPELASDAASWILKNGGVSEISESLARRVIGERTQSDTARAVPTRLGRQQRVASYRRRLRAEPRNPLLWVELAREYSALGQVDSARRALTIALGLAPNNRHVLRSASRFFLHVHEPDMAHRILLASEALASDPWLISAEIVAAGAAGNQSKLVKKGRQLVESGRFAPLHSSELASAIGTMEHEAGNRKQVRKMFSHALIEPTENAVAQAGWIGRHMTGFDLPEGSLAVPRAFEALAWEAVQEERFDDAVAHALEWAEDEPFATRPVLFGSWVASMGLGDFATAADMAEVARTANPDDPRLVAQLLYCRASMDEMAEARALLPELERLTRLSEGSRTQDEWDVVLEADRGLLAYREGNPEIGRRHYEEAIDLAAKSQLPESVATALVNYAREEARFSGQQFDSDLFDGALKAFPDASRSVVKAFVSRIG